MPLPSYPQKQDTSAKENSERYYMREDTPEKAVGAALILQAIALFLGKASNWCSYKLQKGKEFASADKVKHIADKMVKDNKLNGLNVEYVGAANKAALEKAHEVGLGEVARGENAFFSKAKNLAVAPESKPSLMLHELGHAVNATKGRFMKFLQNSRGYVTIVPTALLILSSLLPRKKENKPNFVERNAGLIGFAAFAPTIAEEAIASGRGINAARKVMGKAANLAPLKRNYALALTTYILAGVGLGVAAKETILRNKVDY